MRIPSGPSFASAALCASLATGPVLAQPAGPEDWPCIQVLVPDVVPATVWPRPLEPELEASWSDDAEVLALAERLGAIDALGDDEVAAIRELADDTPAEALAGRLDALVVGTVQNTNRRRSRYIDGIRRYTRQQIAIAEQIEATLNELARLGQGSQPGQVGERSEVQETLAWHERLYDQRERAIRALCEQPVVLEENLYTVMRELQMRLPGS